MSVLHAQVFIAVGHSKLFGVPTLLETCGCHVIHSPSTSALFAHTEVQDCHCSYLAFGKVRARRSQSLAGRGRCRQPVVFAVVAGPLMKYSKVASLHSDNLPGWSLMHSGYSGLALPFLEG